MKKLVILIVLFSAFSYGDFFTDKFFSPQAKPETEKKVIQKTPEPKSQKIDYLQILPTIDEQNPDLTFICSRESQSMSLEDDFLAMIEDAFMPTVFVETGTADGRTTKKAAKRFPCVHSIELDNQLFENAKKSFKNIKNIQVHQGDSAVVLPTIIKSLKDKKDKIVFFLDAHYSMGKTAKGKTNTPILDELEVIRQSQIKNAILIIDDLRMFYTPLTTTKDAFYEGYPTIIELIQAVLSINSDYRFAYIYDALIAFDATENITISPVARAVTMSRLFDGLNYDIKDILRAELCISQAKDKELEAIKSLAQVWTEQWSEQAGLSRHYPLWYGLTLLSHNEFKSGQQFLQEAKKRGLTDWRIDWYIAMAQAECFFAEK